MVKEKIHDVVLLLPNGKPRSIQETGHKSLWKYSQSPENLSGLDLKLFDPTQKQLIENLIKNDEWIIEESNKLIDMLKLK
ncbi:MAG: hypothetical protein JWM28_1012 [Chitinophagaceae bacterium]|nr:hypothetical protein [Chitinophagaceae bacterium]